MMRPVRQRSAQEIHIDAPIGGWNTRDAIDNMPPTDAVVLDNWIPNLGSVDSRPGRELYAYVGAEEDVKTLVVYEGVSAGTVGADYKDRAAVRKLLAFHGSSCTDITDPDNTATITAMTGLASSRWNWALFDNKLVVCNGSDGPFMYAGGAVATDWYDAGTSEFPLSGPDNVENIIGVNVFKNRTWFWEKSSQDVWYSALNTMGGALTKFPLSRVGQFGGHLISMETWTRDGGSGPDDFAVFIMSSGEAIIYQGTSPAQGGDWAIVGIYRIGALLDQRAAVKFGPDLFMITDLDYVNLSEVLSGMEAKTTRTKANGALQSELSENRGRTGWEAIVWPEGRIVIFNVPQRNDEYRQHVFNYVTSAWCRFTGVNAHTWCVYNNELYFGAANGMVYKMPTTAKVDVTATRVGGQTVETSTPIPTAMQPAWTDFGASSRKTLCGIRQFIHTNTRINVSNVFATDYQPFKSQQFPQAVAETGTAWGSPWGSPWSAADKAFADWRVIQGHGSSGAFRQYLNLKQKVKYLGTTWLFKIGERL